MKDTAEIIDLDQYRGEYRSILPEIISDGIALCGIGLLALASFIDYLDRRS